MLDTKFHAFNKISTFKIVFGWFQDSFTGIEQSVGPELDHNVQAGYQKGAAQARENLIFNVVDMPGTASECSIECTYTLYSVHACMLQNTTFTYT